MVESSIFLKPFQVGILTESINMQRVLPDLNRI